MTPLAYRIVKDLTVPAKRRRFVDQCGLLQEMSGIHCFEVSGVLDAMKSVMQPPTEQTVAESWARISDISKQTSFLPAPKSWIEWGDDKGRIGFLLQEQDGFALVQCAITAPFFGTPNYCYSFGLEARGGGTNLYNATRDLTPAEEQDVADHIGSLNGFLAFINARRVIGREEHQPHKGLERKLRAALGAKSDFSLLPWTEIKLQIDATEGEGDGVERLTGQRALHFCRSHLRLRNGRLEQVRAHWRGDPALGVKQSRYRVTDGGAA